MRALPTRDLPVAVVRVIVDTAYTPAGRFAHGRRRAHGTARRCAAIGPALRGVGRPGRAAAGAAGRAAVVLRRRRSGDRHRRAGAASATRARSTCAGRSSTTRTSSPICSGRARCSSTSWTRCPTAPPSCSPRTVWPRRCAPRRQRRELTVMDATCPLVAKVHTEARRFLGRGDTVLLIGHDGHDETEGTLGEGRTIRLVRNAARRGAGRTWPTRRGSSYLTQTTLAVDEVAEIVDVLRERFPLLSRPADGRHLLRDHQPPAGGARHRRRHATSCSCVGSPNSSNSLRLVEVAERGGDARAPGRRRDRASLPEWLRGARTDRHDRRRVRAAAPGRRGDRHAARARSGRGRPSAR